MNNPQYVKVDNEFYKINTDFRIAIECNNIARDETILDYERALAIVYKLFGEKGLKCRNQNKLTELGVKYLLLGNMQNDFKNKNDNKYELDFNKCEGIIRSSFKFDYKYDPYELEYLHWYDFYNDLQNLSTSEFGNCCILNRITSILNQDPNEIKNSTDKKNLIETQKELLKNYCIIKDKHQTEAQRESAKEFYEALGVDL